MAKTPGRAGDAVDQARIRIAWTLAATFVAGGLGIIFGIEYLDRCSGCDDAGAIAMAGIAPAWGAAMAVAAGRWAWMRSFGPGVAVALLLAWVASHFLWSGMVAVYRPVYLAVHAWGWTAGFLPYWLAATAVMVAAVVLAGRWLDSV